MQNSCFMVTIWRKCTFHYFALQKNRIFVEDLDKKVLTKLYNFLFEILSSTRGTETSDKNRKNPG